MSEIITDLSFYYTKDKRIYWNNIVGKEILILHNDIKHLVILLDYNTKTQMMSILIDNQIKTEINRDDFIKARFSKIFRGISGKYKYDINDIINNKIILKQITMRNGTIKNKNGSNKSCKGYIVKCIYDGYEWEVTEYNLVKRGCPVCSNKIVITGVNDIATTHSHLVKYFKNINDARNNTFSCTNKVILKCPYCGYEKTRKIDGLSRDGFGCSKCGDGKSIPEKFMFSLLEQSKILFQSEKVFVWSKASNKVLGTKRYDFYIPSLNCIIETHGSQHYYKSNRGGRTLKDEQENDRLKEQLAKENGIEHYVIIDCRKSDLEFIKNNVLNSKLAELFDLDNVDWLKIGEFALSNRVKEACELWNSGIRSTREIGEILNLNTNTICSYLKKGAVLSWCDYNPKMSSIEYNTKYKPNSKKVMCIETEEVFDKLKDLCHYFEDKFKTRMLSNEVSKVCKGAKSSYKGYTFKFVK